MTLVNKQTINTRVEIAIRGPCNYSCPYCVASNNHETLSRFYLPQLSRLYEDLSSRFVVTCFECGASEPTIHPQFQDILEIVTRDGMASIPTNNSIDPARWIPADHPERMLVRAALHPQGEEDFEGFVRRLIFLKNTGVKSRVEFVAHPQRYEKLQYYQNYFEQIDISFIPVLFRGEYNGKKYPESYEPEELNFLGIKNQSWYQRLKPEMTIRDFKNIPCLAGFRSVYIGPEGNLRRCLYDPQILDVPYDKAVPCQVNHCGCGLLLEQLNTLDEEYWNHWRRLTGLELAEEDDRNVDEVVEEKKAIYWDLIKRYGKIGNNPVADNNSDLAACKDSSIEAVDERNENKIKRVSFHAIRKDQKPKVVLINPWSEDEEGVHWTPQYQQDYWRNPYIGLVELATYLESLGHPIKIIDCERDLLIEADGNPDWLLKFVEKRIRFLRPDVIGVTGMTYRYPQSYRILKTLGRLKDELKFKLILGGCHASGEPEMCLEDIPELDCIFVGFAEVGLKAFLNGASLDQVPGIIYKGNGQVKSNPKQFITDLDELPTAKWSMIDAGFYTHPNIRIHRSKTTPLRSLDTVCSRSCNRACNFCARNECKPIWRSVDNILEFIRHTQEKFGTNATIFQDSSLGNNPRFLYALCEGILAKGMQKNLIWTANMNAGQIDTEISKLMYRAGCRLVFVGFESGSDRMLKLMRKGTTVADNLQCAHILEQTGMPYWASFIIGYPGETEEDILATIRFVERINPTTGWANSFTPFPGSPVYDQLKQEGKIQVRSTEDWMNYSRTGWGNTHEGLFADMDPGRFENYRVILKNKFSSITERGLKRPLEFSA